MNEALKLLGVITENVHASVYGTKNRAQLIQQLERLAQLLTSNE